LNKLLDYPEPCNKEMIDFIEGRIKFLLNGKQQKSPSFGSMVVIWR